MVITLHELATEPVKLMKSIRESGEPAFVTEYGRFIAVIRPLKPGEVENAVLPEIAREIAERARPLHTESVSLNDD